MLQGKTALITGARGLGAAIAERFWWEGASLLLVARTEHTLRAFVEGLPHRAGQEVRWLAADLAGDEEPLRIAKWAISRQGGVNILVNNAAVQGPIGLAWETDWDSWVSAFRINAFAPIALCRAVVADMVRRGISGRVINISGGGATSARPRFTSYACAKTALVRFTETLAEEVRPFGITANAIAPGAMATGMLGELICEGAHKAGQEEFERAKVVAREGGADLRRVATLCALLASERGNDITGRLISAVWDPWEDIEGLARVLDTTDIYTLRRIVPSDRKCNKSS